MRAGDAKRVPQVIVLVQPVQHFAAMWPLPPEGLWHPNRRILAQRVAPLAQPVVVDAAAAAERVGRAIDMHLATEI